MFRVSCGFFHTSVCNPGFRRLWQKYRFVHSRVVVPQQLSSLASLLPNIDAFVFDCDGVIWKGDEIISGVPRSLEKLREDLLRHKQFHEISERIFTKISKSGSFSQSISFAAAAYFEKHPLPFGRKVYVIGGEGICEELSLIGVPYFGGPTDAGKVIKLGPGVKKEYDPSVAAVVVGFDLHINYYKIQYAQLCINNISDCKFIATNLDAVKHLTAEQEWAGNGAIVGAIKGCTGKEPILVGKPAPLLIDYLAEKYHLNRSRVCMVGDRLDTDIVFGLNNGLKTILTLSGVTSEEKLLAKENQVHPHYYVRSLADFFP